ncbi:hypothetical protein D3C77_350870 [compost metagenome]
MIVGLATSRLDDVAVISISFACQQTPIHADQRLGPETVVWAIVEVFDPCAFGLKLSLDKFLVTEEHRGDKQHTLANQVLYVIHHFSKPLARNSLTERS